MAAAAAARAQDEDVIVDPLELAKSFGQVAADEWTQIVDAPPHEVWAGGRPITAIVYVTDRGDERMCTCLDTEGHVLGMIIGRRA